MNFKYNKPYNIYFGTIGKTLGVKYQFTKSFKNLDQANEHAKECAVNFYYKHEGKCGLPSWKDIVEESKITELPIEVLYEDHINDMMRYFVIPTEVDSIPQRKLNWK